MEVYSAADSTESTDFQPHHDILFSFAAAGWLQMYHFGAGKALQDTGIATVDALTSTDNPLGTVRFAGSSAGALAASALVVGADFDALREYACGCAVDCRGSWTGALKLRHYVRRGVELFATGAFRAANERAEARRKDTLVAQHRLAEAAKEENLRRRRALASVDDPPAPGSATGDTAIVDEADDCAVPKDDMSSILQEKLEVYATTIPFLRAKRFSTFDGVEDLDEALTASCLLVPLAGLPFRVRETGEWVMDGGVAAFQPRAGERGVITLSAMYFASADIKPSIFVPVWWGLYPPNDDQYRSLFALGYNDCIDGLLRKRLITPETFGRLRDKYPNDAGERLPKRGYVAITRDAVAFFFFMFVLRPLGLVLVYVEMFTVLFATAVVALLHDILPSSFGLAALVLGTHTTRRREGTRWAAWTDVYLAVRNLVSMRVPVHLMVGSRIPVNSKRLERYSRVYRALRPFLG